MARSFWNRRQEIINGYLADTGCNVFDPGDFVDWLSDQPEHEAYSWFFAKDDAAAAREYRIELARRMAAGLRITVRVEQPTRGKAVRLAERSYPAFISPVSGRRSGGGYQPFCPNDPASMDELRRQGLVSLASWIERYAGVFEASGVDCDPIRQIAAASADRVASAA